MTQLGFKLKMDYEDNCELICINNGTNVLADIINYIPKSKIILALNKQVRLTLKYNENEKKYFGNMSTLEFKTNGPKPIRINRGRT